MICWNVFKQNSFSSPYLFPFKGMKWFSVFTVVVFFFLNLQRRHCATNFSFLDAAGATFISFFRRVQCCDVTHFFGGATSVTDCEPATHNRNWKQASTWSEQWNGKNVYGNAKNYDEDNKAVDSFIWAVPGINVSPGGSRTAVSPAQVTPNYVFDSRYHKPPMRMTIPFFDSW